jgi:disulfide bond formation protein DsbB
MTESAAPLDSPVPRKGVVFEVLRSGLILGGLLGATLLFAFVHAWIIAGIIFVITILGAISGAVVHPKQLTSAMRPKAVGMASATPVARYKQTWLLLDDKSGRTLAVELRSRRLAKSIGQQTVPVTIAGQLDPGEWIVVQTMSMTIWPASKVEEGMPRGASYDLRRLSRTTWRDMMR